MKGAEDEQLTFNPHGNSDGDGGVAFRWTRAAAWASLWHKPWAKLKLTLGNEDGSAKTPK